MENESRYKRGYVQTAVCEIRFPTILEFANPDPPIQIVKSLRRDYPILNAQNEIKLGVNSGKSSTKITHEFATTNRKWTLSVKQSSIVFQANAYHNYSDFKARFLKAFDSIKDSLDADFLTRIGLRYVNAIKTEPEGFKKDFLNEMLVSPLLSGKFNNVNEYAGKIQLVKNDGGLILQHGIRFADGTTEDHPIPDYMIDIDTYRVDLPIDHVEGALDIMHAQAFTVFDLCLGTKAKEKLSQ
ncbi:TIGR04255 family protein [Acidithiobacillus ferrianus]|nr:TIGR04255 family protein [Acidithiobacillus ferrianus]